MRTKGSRWRNGLRLSQVSSCGCNLCRYKILNGPILSATKCGFVPELTWDDKLLVQSNAIARFVAREVDIAGKSNVEMAQCDAVVDFCSELAEGKS